MTRLRSEVGRRAPKLPRFRCNLRSIRRARGVTQRRIAEVMGLAGASVSLWETGSHRPSAPNMLKLCRLLGVKPKDIWPDFEK
jgi:transcriptional regulator with XRE-family HTH domain